ncbi:MAG: sigma-54 dependent transcriptional regulator [Gemmatimonadota bacterium]|jgi:two-component system response regulator FlrC|nr:sigma-54 dependent transcriptional regulator [Gemmatimonadota bacterium]
MSRILVVDDEAGIREFIGDALESDGYAVTDASNAPEALHHLRAGSFGVLITDLRMPGSFDGMELVRRVRSEIPGMVIIVLTAYGTVETAVEAMKLGAFDFLRKPLGGPDELRCLVRRAVEHRSLTAPVTAVGRSRGDSPVLTFGDPVMAPAVRSLEKVAPTSATVLLLGESGTGKEVAARAIHEWSRSRTGPFVSVNCAAISDPLMEREIFGYEQGAFPGADTLRRGRLELAEGGTFFLDGIGELKADLQAKLLRVIQDRSFTRVGGNRVIDVDIRWIAATNRDLEAMVRSGAFREDLYHRLAAFPIHIPPLRDRREDLIPLAESLLVRISANLGRPPLLLDREAVSRIRAAHWSGNVRELANVLERSAILAEGQTLRGADLLLPSVVPSPRPEATTNTALTMADIESEAIRRALSDVGGNRRRAAERLGIGVRTLYEKLKRYGIE